MISGGAGASGSAAAEGHDIAGACAFQLGVDLGFAHAAAGIGMVEQHEAEAGAHQVMRDGRPFARDGLGQPPCAIAAFDLIAHGAGIGNAVGGAEGVEKRFSPGVEFGMGEHFLQGDHTLDRYDKRRGAVCADGFGKQRALAGGKVPALRQIEQALEIEEAERIPDILEMVRDIESDILGFVRHGGHRKRV